MITDPVRCNSSADTARHSGTSALIAFALLNDSAEASGTDPVWIEPGHHCEFGPRSLRAD
jgi:hypothetical protein